MSVSNWCGREWNPAIKTWHQTKNPQGKRSGPVTRKRLPGMGDGGQQWLTCLPAAVCHLWLFPLPSPLAAISCCHQQSPPQTAVFSFWSHLLKLSYMPRVQIANPVEFLLKQEVALLVKCRCFGIRMLCHPWAILNILIIPLHKVPTCGLWKGTCYSMISKDWCMGGGQEKACDLPQLAVWL